MATELTEVIEGSRLLSANASIEATPDAILSATSLRRTLGCGRLVYVPFLPRADIADTVAACRRLVGEGLIPVPHLAARAVPSRRQLDDWLGLLTEAGTKRVLLIAGDARRPRGPFRDTLAVLETGLLVRHGIRHIDVAGYPEGHPRVADGALWQALEQKAAYARETATEMWLVSQFAFEAAPIAAWLAALEKAEIGLPVRIGIPGPAQLRTLLGFALRCGVGASASAVIRRPVSALKLAAQWDPNTLLADLARLRGTDQAGRLAGIHVYAFGGGRQAAAWLDAASVSAPSIDCAAHLPEPGTADRRAYGARARFQPVPRRAEEETDHAGTDQP